jgi:hypothetical protein
VALLLQQCGLAKKLVGLVYVDNHLVAVVGHTRDFDWKSVVLAGVSAFLAFSRPTVKCAWAAGRVFAEDRDPAILPVSVDPARQHRTGIRSMAGNP